MKPDRPLDPSLVDQCHRDWCVALERYAWAVVRDRSLAADAVQNAFVLLSRFGGDVAPDARKAWLYKVVHREAVRVRTTEGRHQALKESNGTVAESIATYQINPLGALSQMEDATRIRQRIESLPSEQKLIVQLRIFEDKTFAEIASDLNIPLGTALSRMRLALQRLREGETDEDYGK